MAGGPDGPFWQKWYAWWDSNPRPLPPQGSALSAELQARKTDRQLGAFGFQRVGKGLMAESSIFLVPREGFEPTHP